jgi:hypothetical protein
MSSICFGQADNCAKLFQQGQLVEAADCFESLSNKMSESPSLSATAKLEKGQYLRNAAIALEKAAAAEQRVEVAAFLRERAVAFLARYDREKLYETDYRKQIAMAQQAAIQKEIGYAPLGIVTNNPEASIIIEAYRFQKKAKGNWNASVRPGAYKLTVTYPSKPSIVRKITVSPNNPRLETFKDEMIVPTSRPKESKKTLPDAVRAKPSLSRAKRDSQQLSHKLPPPRSEIPTWSWVGYIGGGVTILTGGIMLGVGSAQWYAVEREYKANLSAVNQKDLDYDGNLTPRRDRAQLLIWPGIGLLGTGISLMLTGIVLHVSTKQHVKEVSPTSTGVHAKHKIHKIHIPMF